MVVTAGLTVRVAGLLTTPLWTTPSDQVTLQGALPLSAALIVVELPAQIVALPLTVATGNGLTLTTALPVPAPPVQLTSDTAVTV